MSSCEVRCMCRIEIEGRRESLLQASTSAMGVSSGAGLASGTSEAIDWRWHAQLVDTHPALRRLGLGAAMQSLTLQPDELRRARANSKVLSFYFDDHNRSRESLQRLMCDVALAHHGSELRMSDHSMLQHCERDG